MIRQLEWPDMIVKYVWNLMSSVWAGLIDDAKNAVLSQLLAPSSKHRQLSIKHKFDE